MTERARIIDDFLRASGWSDADRAPLAGDASNRRYERLHHDGIPAVLMDAPPAKGEDVRPFLSVGSHLATIGLSAPKIYAQDEIHGLLLIEDLGDDLYSKVVARDPEMELPLYLAATETLIALHRAPLPEAPDYGPETMTRVAGLAHDWYAFGAKGHKDTTARDKVQSHLADAFAALAPWTPVLVLRDFHAENLLWLPERDAPANVGLLDFQDAGLGHPAYDLMSLARDARRDVDPATAEAMIDRYVTQTGLDLGGFEQACATVSAQRNLRILGVFARLSMHFGKAHYVDLIPRVWENLMLDLAHPALGTLRDSVLESLPDPDPTTLKLLKEKCGTIPHL